MCVDMIAPLILDIIPAEFRIMNPKHYAGNTWAIHLDLSRDSALGHNLRLRDPMSQINLDRVQVVHVQQIMVEFMSLDRSLENLQKQLRRSYVTDWEWDQSEMLEGRARSRDGSDSIKCLVILQVQKTKGTESFVHLGKFREQERKVVLGVPSDAHLEVGEWAREHLHRRYYRPIKSLQ